MTRRDKRSFKKRPRSIACSDRIYLPVTYCHRVCGDTIIMTTIMTDIRKTQKILWDSYLASGRCGVALFKSIDTENSQKISAKNLRSFLQSVEGGGGNVNDDAFDAILELADDHELKLKEFLSHLVHITQGEMQMLNSIKISYESQPSVGMRGSMMMSTLAGGIKAIDLQKLKDLADDEDEDEDAAAGDEDEHAWNEVTMAQNLRKMQYAVRGEVVMKADLMKAEGRDIVYTVSACSSWESYASCS